MLVEPYSDVLQRIFDDHSIENFASQIQLCNVSKWIDSCCENILACCQQDLHGACDEIMLCLTRRAFDPTMHCNILPKSLIVISSIEMVQHTYP